jgi:uncharacterized delta-60 repeat protein
VDKSGNVYVTGYSSVSGAGYDYVTIKYDANGKQLWATGYNGPGNSTDFPYAIAVDGAGGVYVTGYSWGSGTDYDYATIKYNAYGNQLWVKRYNGPGNGSDTARAIAVDGAGSVYITGYSSGSGSGSDYATIKYNTNGKQLWATRYNGPGNSTDSAYAIAADGAGNVCVTGESLGSGSDYDYATLKYSISGKQLWATRYNGPRDGGDSASAIAADGAGNVYVTGKSLVSGVNYDYATVKYNTNGKQLWAKRFNGPGNSTDEAKAVAVDGAGNVLVTGESLILGSDFDCATIKYNTNGKKLWATMYKGPGTSLDEAKAVALDGSGNAYVTGWSWGAKSDDDYATIKYSTNGKQLWVKRYNGPGNGRDCGWAVAVDDSGNIYVTGMSLGLGTGFDFATIKY